MYKKINDIGITIVNDILHNSESLIIGNVIDEEDYIIWYDRNE